MAGLTLFSSFEEVRLAAIAMLRGEQNNTGRFTLRNGQTTTVVQHPNCSPGKSIVTEPMTANAAAEKGNGTMYIPATSILKGSFTVVHANAGSTDRTFMYELTGGG